MKWIKSRLFLLESRTKTYTLTLYKVDHGDCQSISSSESEYFESKPANKKFFVNLLSEHVVVFEKSIVPRVVQQNNSKAIGNPCTVGRLNKMLVNMRTQIKKKGDMKETGNKPIKMKDWNNNLLLLPQEDNPVFQIVPKPITTKVGRGATKITSRFSTRFWSWNCTDIC